MNTRSRIVRAAVAVAAVIVVAACADKVFRPSQPASPKIQLQFSATGARQVNAAGARQVLIAVSAYFSSVLDANGDSVRYLAKPVLVPVSGTSAQITLNVDLTNCLADPTRRGSQSACSLYYAVALHDSAGFNADSSDLFKGSYDYAIVGPIDVAPGKPPVLAPITLSESRFSIFQFTGDEALRLGGPLTPQGFTGPIAGAANGATGGSPLVLFALTYGPQSASGCTSGPSNCPGNGNSSAQLAIFQNGQWSRVSGPLGQTNFNDVAAFSPTDVYIGGPAGLYHYDGNSISQVGGVTGGGVASLGITGSGTSKLVIAGMGNGSTWIGNTSTWKQYPMPANSATINNVCITGPNEAFATSTNNGGIYRFDGTTWTQTPSTFSQPKGDLQCPAPGQAFMWAQGAAILSWSGSGWTTLPSTGRLVRIAVVSPTEIYAAGDSANVNRKFYRFDGTSWHLLATTQFTQPIFYRPWADPRGGAAYFASAFGRVEVVSGASAHPVSYAPSIRDAIMTSASNAIAVGWNLFLARWNGSIWTVDAPPTGTTTTRALNGVYSDGPSNAWAVGGFSTILHFDGSRWSVVGDSAHPATAQRDSYNAVWGSGGTILIAGMSSIVRCTALTSCSNDPVSGVDSLLSIWGTSATDAWAVGAHGKIMHYDGKLWTAAATPTAKRLSRVWGTSASNVWAVGDSVIVHYDGTSWTAPVGANDQLTNSPNAGGSNPSFQLGIWGNSATDMYFGSWFGNVFRFDGFQWNDVTNSAQSTGGRIVAIAGYPGGCALAFIDGQTTFNSPTMLRGVGPNNSCLGSPMPASTPWP